MSKTSKIRRAREARDRALQEASVAYGDAKYFQANEREAVRRVREIEDKWRYVIEILGRTLPKEDLLRAIGDAVPQTRANFDSAFTERWEVATHHQWPEMFQREVEHAPMEAFFSPLHQLVVKYYEATRHSPNMQVQLEFNDRVTRFAMTTDAFDNAPLDYIVQHVATELVRYIRRSPKHRGIIK